MRVCFLRILLQVIRKLMRILRIMSKMELIKKVLQFFVKYVVPLIVGWLEGSTKVLENLLFN